MSSSVQQQGQQEQVPRTSQSQQQQQQSDDITVAVCCGCRPRASRRNRQRKYQVRRSWAPSDALRQIIQGPNAWKSNRMVINQNGDGGQQNGFQESHQSDVAIASCKCNVIKTRINEYTTLNIIEIT